jgi:hypothetical protein
MRRLKLANGVGRMGMIFTKKPDMLFIKMCEKADDLQKIKSEDEQRYKRENYEDAYYALPYDEIYYRGAGIPEPTLGQCEKSWWIPNQRQMQDMIVVDIEKYADVMEKLTLEKRQEFVFNTLVDVINNWAKSHKEFYTFDQIWLSYLMMYKFNKIWVDCEWVKF